MKYYQYLDLECQSVCQQLKEFVLRKPEIIKGFWTELDVNMLLSEIQGFQEVFDPLNIHIDKVSLIYTDRTVGAIHTDTSPVAVRINLPVLNCENTETIFYKSSVPPVRRYLPNGVPYEHIDPIMCTIVDRFCLSGPTAIRVLAPHSTAAASEDLPRISCTVRFKENIDYLLD